MTAIDYEEIKQRVSITEVLAKYAPVPDFHRNTYRMPCPLHQGDGDNFKVDEEQGKFWCHVCHCGGDVISLLARFEKISNSAAALKLMETHKLSQSDTFARTWRKTYRQMRWMEQETAPPALEEGEIPVTEDLYGYRNFSKPAIDHFGLRLIPGSGWGCGIYIPIRVNDILVGYSVRHNDAFRKEWRDRNGRLAPKYLNTESLNKEAILYGLSENAEAIRQAGCVYLVEGQFDCIAMWDRGYRNTVAVMGSNLSSYQAQTLMAVTSHLNLVFDGDDAGREGMSLIKSRYSSLFTISITHLPDGTDPATADIGAS